MNRARPPARLLEACSPHPRGPGTGPKCPLRPAGGWTPPTYLCEKARRRAGPQRALVRGKGRAVGGVFVVMSPPATVHGACSPSAGGLFRRTRLAVRPESLLPRGGGPQFSPQKLFSGLFRWLRPVPRPACCLGGGLPRGLLMRREGLRSPAPPSRARSSFPRLPSQCPLHSFILEGRQTSSFLPQGLQPHPMRVPQDITEHPSGRDTPRHGELPRRLS